MRVTFVTIPRTAWSSWPHLVLGAGVCPAPHPFSGSRRSATRAPLPTQCGHGHGSGGFFFFFFGFCGSTEFHVLLVIRKMISFFLISARGEAKHRELQIRPS